jgi:hypothetical protein
MAHEGVPLVAIRRQLGTANLGVTSIYLQGIVNAEISNTGHHRAAPMIPAAAREPNSAHRTHGRQEHHLTEGESSSEPRFVR